MDRPHPNLGDLYQTFAARLSKMLVSPYLANAPYLTNVTMEARVATYLSEPHSGHLFQAYPGVQPSNAQFVYFIQEICTILTTTPYHGIFLDNTRRDMKFTEDQPLGN